MEVVELLVEVAPLVLSALATIVAFVKGKTKTIKSVEQIKAEADKKYSAYVEKQCKKNKIENVSVESSNFDEVQKVFGPGSQISKNWNDWFKQSDSEGVDDGKEKKSNEE